MKARITMNGVEYPLCEIQEADMDAFHRAPPTAQLYGVPAYFDERGRTWPCRGKDIPEVEFYE
ncbi:MAG: hypothetical protein KGL35_24740 [Bradyrhizobium sp.]|nr:hypothetical protein [Bradyrhizobium sp.]